MTEESLFEEALGLPAGERAAFLEHACAGKPELRIAVEARLAVHEKSGHMLDRPRAKHAATVGSGPESDQAATGGLTAQPDNAPVHSVTTTHYQRNAEPGVVIAGRYTLLEPIGEGGMGEVWVARQTEPVKRKVALKLIKAGMDSRAVLQRFEQERQALAMMDHPNIARVLDGGMTPTGQPFFVMELVNGLPLTKFCDEAKLTPRERLELFMPICQAVQHAHQKGIVHRDLKPSNILVTLIDGRPVPKVIDFGVAKATGGKLTDESMSTQFGAIVGTLEYMSPEQAGLSGVDIDTRADIYSLGVILYEQLTGLKPHDSVRLRKAALTEMIRIIQEEDPSKPSTRLSTDGSFPSLAALRQTEPKQLISILRGELDWVVMKCLEKQRDRRYETASSLARDIQRYLADEPVEARPPSAGYRLRKFIRRNRGQFVAGAAVLLAIVAGAGVAVWQAVLATRAESAVRIEKGNAEHERDEKEKARQAEAEHRVAAETERNEALRQKKRADDEADVAKAVTDFLRYDLLEQAAVANQPLEGHAPRRNPDLKVRELLDRAARRIEGRFPDQPLVEAAVRLTLANTYLDLGEYDKAENHLQRALGLRKQLLGSDDLEILTCMNNLGLLYHHQGRYDQAEPLLSFVVDKRTDRQGANHLDTLTAMSNLALLYKTTARYDKAEPLLRHVLKQRSEQLGDDDAKTLAIQSDLASLYSIQAKYDQAEPLFKQLLAKLSATLGDDHHDTLMTMTSLALAYEEQGKYDQAEPLFSQVVDKSITAKGLDHVDTLTARDNLALLYYYQKKYDKAEPIFTEVLAKRTSVLGADHPHTLTSQHNLALLYLARKDLALAEPLLKVLVAKRTALLGADHPDTLGSKSNLASLYWHRHQFQDAAQLYKELLDSERAKLGDDHPTVAFTAFNLAVNYRDAGQLAEAEATVEAWLPRSRAKFGLQHDGVQFGVNTALSIYERTGEHAKAESLLRDLAALRKDQHGADSIQYGSALASIGHVLLKQQQFANAEPILRECLAIYETKYPAAWPNFALRSQIGEALLGQNKLSDAETLLLQGYNGLKQRESQIPPNFRSRLTEAVERLVKLYEASDKKEEVAKWSNELNSIRTATQPLGQSQD